MTCKPLATYITMQTTAQCTVHGRCIVHPAAELADVEEKKLVAKLDRVLNRISQRGSENLVEFNAKKTHVYAFSTKCLRYFPSHFLEHSTANIGKARYGYLPRPKPAGVHCERH